ncbi:carboxypeptidase-like regulatory domain-containing protein [Hymenobacter armeniacus]|uniref:Carboxypeptidase regulatory-like domain-containing protein n=1 Tax=Hymenobacter armeniacus TaxID=2771358 RepID=A0ABR8JRS3_9BACT|nr:carboxypeptidase-like regulatory domain-containing protein [Hymenobacter armeniacus]MBD2721616.1 carboxypeptidase regulatory-like domain-containing protein [Hymenobacter armeniacus]
MIALLALGCTACAGSRELALGDYRETHGPGVVLWTAKHLRLLPGQAFEYDMSSDDLASGKNGAGTYQRQGHTLELIFNGQPLVRASTVRLHSLPTASDSVRLTFAVRQADAWDVLQPAAGVSVVVRDQQGHPKAQVQTDSAGWAEVLLPRAWYPCTLSVSSIGYQPLQQDAPPSSTAYQVSLQPSAGRLYDAGSRLEFKVVRQTSSQLVLRQGAEKIILEKAL